MYNKNDIPCVVHIKDPNTNKPRKYIGRGSKWGNQFKIGIDGNRKDVIRKHKSSLLQNEELIKSLPELAGHELACFCKPKACHGDTLVEEFIKRHINK